MARTFHVPWDHDRGGLLQKIPPVPSRSLSGDRLTKGFQDPRHSGGWGLPAYPGWSHGVLLASVELSLRR